MQSSWAWAWPWLVRRLQAAVVRRDGPCTGMVASKDRPSSATGPAHWTQPGRQSRCRSPPRAWPESVPQGCRLEVRYAAGGRKYRMVSEGAPPSWPPRLPAPGKRPAMGSLLSATAVCPGHSRLDCVRPNCAVSGPLPGLPRQQPLPGALAGPLQTPPAPFPVPGGVRCAGSGR